MAHLNLPPRSAAITDESRSDRAVISSQTQPRHRQRSVSRVSRRTSTALWSSPRRVRPNTISLSLSCDSDTHSLEIRPGVLGFLAAVDQTHGYQMQLIPPLLSVSGSTTNPSKRTRCADLLVRGVTGAVCLCQIRVDLMLSIRPRRLSTQKPAPGFNPAHAGQTSQIRPSGEILDQPQRDERRATLLSYFTSYSNYYPRLTEHALQCYFKS